MGLDDTDSPGPHQLPSSPTIDPSEAVESAYWENTRPAGRNSLGRLTLALPSRQRDQVYQQSTRQNWRALQLAGAGYCTSCFGQCLVRNLGWRADGAELEWTDVAASSVFTDAAVAWLYQLDPSLCTSFSAACPRCQGRVLPITVLPAATPGCDVQLEHRILLMWCHRDHHMQGRAWRLWRTHRAWRRLLVVVLAANRLRRVWLDVNAHRYAPGGAGHQQASLSFVSRVGAAEVHSYW